MLNACPSCTCIYLVLVLVIKITYLSLLSCACPMSVYDPIASQSRKTNTFVDD